MSNGFGLIPWGTGAWGLPIPPTPLPPRPSDIHVIDVVPAPGSFNISRSQTFTFTIKSAFFAVKPESVYIFLDNQVAVNGLIVDPNFTVLAQTNVDGISIDFQITPNYLFQDGELFTLQVYATDIYGNPSFPFWAGYLVQDTRPPFITPIYPIDKQIEIPIDMTLHFLVNQTVSNGSGLNRGSLNVSINETPAVVNSVIQPGYEGVYSAINFPSVGDLTSPFEVILDSEGLYEKLDIVVISISATTIVEPETDTAAVFLNQYGQDAKDAYGATLPSFSITDTLEINNFTNKLTLAFSGDSLILDGYIQDGYQVKNSNGNKFHILNVIDGYNVLVETLPKTFAGKFSFVTTEFYEALTSPIFAGYFQGIYRVDNLGDGYNVQLMWHPARTVRKDSDLAFLVYYSTVRSDVFVEDPKLITQGKVLPKPEDTPGTDSQLFGFSAQLKLPIGITYFFGVRATEYPHTTIPFVPKDGYQSEANGYKTTPDKLNFLIPASLLLRTTTTGSGAIVVEVMNTDGFPTIGGYIVVNTEIMRYSSLTSTTFVIPSNGRGLFGSTIRQTHNAGETVRYYTGSMDDNSVIAKNIVLWEPPNDPHRPRPDLITTDLSLEDAYGIGFEPFDYCGYHRQRPDELFQDETCNTYVGGLFNGHRGLFLSERVLANEEQLLEIDGEPVILLKRIWKGETCFCRTSRKDSARVRSCAICFGTGFKGGFTQFFNPRRNDKRLMVHFAPNDEDFGFGPQSAIEQKFKPNAWTLMIPQISDRDYLVRFDKEDPNKLQWIYVVNTVSRGETIFGTATRQRLNISRVDKTDVINMFKFVK